MITCEKRTGLKYLKHQSVKRCECIYNYYSRYYYTTTTTTH